MVSYHAHVKKMLDLFKISTRSPGLRELWKFTQKGRAYEIRKNLFSSVDQVLKTKCPLLDPPVYVSSCILLLIDTY